MQIKSKVAQVTFHTAMSILSRGNAAYHIFGPQCFWEKTNIEMVDSSSVKGKDESNQQVCSGITLLHYCPQRRRGLRWEKDSLSLPFVLREVHFHLMCISFSSVFKRLRLGCMNSSSESSVSSSFSFVVGVSSISAISGNSSPGKICCSFSSKYMPTACPNTAISDPTCGRRGGGMWRWQEAGGMDGLKQEEKEIEIN